MRVAVVGNSNSGKTTLFNALTGANEKTGNWHGVTVDKAVKPLKNDKNVEIVDLSGLESLSTYSIEEERSKDYLLKTEVDLIINVIEISNFKNAVKLTKELERFNKPILVFFNFYNEFISSGGQIDFEILKKFVSDKIIVGDATDAKTVKEIALAIENKRFSKIKVDEKKALNAICFPEIKLSKLDRLLTNAKTAVTIYLSVILATYYVAFGKYGLGNAIGTGIERAVDFITNYLNTILTEFSVNPFLSGLITEGVCAVGSVFTFIPQILVLQFLLICLEESGIIARISFVTDNFLSKIGLNGKSVFTLLTGFGCTAISVKLSSGLENEKVKAKTAKALPFIICSAKIPVIVFFAQKIFKEYAFIILFSAYVLSVVSCVIYLWLDKKIKKEKSAPMLLLVPRLRRINLKICLKSLKKSVKEFIIKLGTIITLVSVAVYLLKSVSVNFDYVGSLNIDKSILAFIGGKIKYVFAPIKLDSWEISTAILSGVFAKESIISTLQLINGGELSLSVNQAVAILVFVLFYTPCVCALESYRIEFGFKFACKIAIYQFIFALLGCYFTYYFLQYGIVKIVIACIIAIKVVYEIVRCKKTGKIVKNVAERV